MAGLFFFATGIAAMSVQPECPDDILWSGCKLYVPLCQFHLSCNCAVLRIRKHNFTSLPSSIVNMKAMKTMEISNGPLQRCLILVASCQDLPF